MRRIGCIRRFTRRTAVAAAALAIAAPAVAEEVVIAVATEPTSLDPLFQALGSNHELAKHAFNSLVEPGPKYELEPGLAESWGPTDDPLVWEFKLRKGVKFCFVRILKIIWFFWVWKRYSFVSEHN